MKFFDRRHVLFALLLVAATAVTFFCYSCSSGTGGGTTPLSNGDVNTFISKMQANGFIVQEGELRSVDILKLCSEGYLPSCYGNNYGAPYLVYILPPAPGQNPATGQNPPVGYNPDAPDNYPANPDIVPVGGSSKLRPDEAVVLIGKTPPQATYTGYTYYLGLRENIPGKDYTGVYTTGNDTVGHYHRLFASLGDTLNPLTLKTSGTPDGQPGNPFNSNVAIISTADRGINDRVSASLVQAGFPSSATNTQAIPSSVVNMGLEKGKDTMIFLQRIAIWQNSAEGQDYLGNPGNYARVFRITPTQPSVTDPYPVPTLNNRGTGVSELQVAPFIENDMQTLRQGILNRYATNDYTYTEMSTSMWLPQGYVGIANDTDELADNNDTTYLRTPSFQFSSDDDFLVIYGIDHTKTGKATYINLTFYGEELLNGFANIFGSTLQGTADQYFAQGYANSKYYYAYKVARKNPGNEQNVLILPYSTGNPSGKAYGLDNDKNGFVSFRAYLEHPTRTGPSYFEIVYDRAIMFKKRVP